VLLADLEGGEPREIGRHQGLWRFTEGQRQGLGIAWSEPLYVLDKDVEKNALLVGPAALALAVGVEAGEFNLLVPFPSWPGTGAKKEVLVRTRYRQEPAAARASLDEDAGTLRLDFAKPSSLPAPGQVAAVYDAGGVVLGGGTIRRVLRIGGKKE